MVTLKVSGYGSGSGYGDGYGSGYGDGYGYGTGDGYGYGIGYGIERNETQLRSFLEQAIPGGGFTARMALDIHNAELKRIAIETLGPERFFLDLQSQIIHQDSDGVGNQRRLLRIPLSETEAGWVQAVHVICPTTGREYYLGVPPSVTTCQEAVASTFGLQAQEYQPVRET